MPTPTIDETIQQVEIELVESRVQIALTGALRTATPQQAVDYIENNVTNLATAKEVLKLMARMLIVLRDKVTQLKD
jgi:hypothetical protein